MDVEEIRRLRLANPFQPFRVTLNDDRQFDLKKSHHLAMAENNSKVLIVTGTESAVWFAPQAVKELAVFPIPSTQHVLGDPTGEVELIDVAAIASIRSLSPVDPQFVR